jgi:pectin methylesterase-like acyl-CoA thioesterase
MLSVMDRYDLCLEALRALQAQHPNGLLADAIAALAAAKPALDSADDTSYKTELKRMSSVFATLRAGAADDDPTVAAVQPVKGFFVYVQHGEDYALKATLQLTAAVLERAHDAGLTGWRSDVRPSRFDEPS